MSKGKAARDYNWKEAWVTAAPSKVGDIAGYVRHDDMIEGFTVYERVFAVKDVIGTTDPGDWKRTDVAALGDLANKDSKTIKENDFDLIQNVAKTTGKHQMVSSLPPSKNCCVRTSATISEKSEHLFSKNFLLNNSEERTPRIDVDKGQMVATSYGSTHHFLPPFSGTAAAAWDQKTLPERCSDGRSIRSAVWVSLDTEYVGGENVDKRWKGHRQVVSWQIGFGLGGDFIEWMIIPRTDKPLSIDVLLTIIGERLGVPIHYYVNYPRKYNSDGEWDGRSGTSRAPAYPLMFISHAGLVDLSTFAGSKRFLQSLSNKGAAMFNVMPTTRVVTHDSKRTKFRRYSLNVRDSASFAGNGASLAKLGHAVGLEKLDMSEDDYLNMSAVLENEPERFAAYAMRDVEIVYRYMSQLPVIERDTIIPATSPACAANYLKNYIVANQYDNDGRRFEPEWRGECKVNDGLEMAESGRGFYMKSHFASVNIWADELISLARQSMHGGVNAAYEVGFYTETSWDYDLCGAYPLALGSLYDPDYSKPFAQTFEGVWLDKQMFPHDWLHDPFVPGFGVVQFEFPETCYHPCIPFKTPHGLIFPRTSKGTSGVPATLAEVMLALELGADVYALRFVVPRVHDRDGILLNAYHDLIKVRNEQKDLYGKKSVQQQAIKLVNCAGYGKIAQDLSPKMRRDLWSLETGEIEPSKVTSAPHAAAGTGIVRCVLIAAINQLHSLGRGYHVYSATTDGFISDAPKSVLDSLNLYGLRYRLAWVQSQYTDGERSDIFEVKHTNTGGLLNFTTRGNVGLNVSPDPDNHPELDGVFARAGYKGFKDGTLQDRYDFTKKIVNRSAPLPNAVRQWVSAADMLKHDEDFHTFEVSSHRNPNFDMKRKPVIDSMHEVTFEVDGEELTTPNYDTEPYETIEEFERYKSRADRIQLTRMKRYMTVDERARNATNSKREYSQRDLVRFAVMAYRNHMVDIPDLDKKRGKERLDFINKFIDDDRPFSSNDWKDAGKQSRASSIPEMNKYIDIVESMGGTAKVEGNVEVDT